MGNLVQCLPGVVKIRNRFHGYQSDISRALCCRLDADAVTRLLIAWKNYRKGKSLLSH